MRGYNAKIASTQCIAQTTKWLRVDTGVFKDVEATKERMEEAYSTFSQNVIEIGSEDPEGLFRSKTSIVIKYKNKIKYKPYTHLRTLESQIQSFLDSFTSILYQNFESLSEGMSSRDTTPEIPQLRSLKQYNPNSIFLPLQHSKLWYTISLPTVSIEDESVIKTQLLSSSKLNLDT